MKYIICSAVIAIAALLPARAFGQVQSNKGVGNWEWEKTTDEMTDEVKYLFAEKPLSVTGEYEPLLVVSKIGGQWGLILQIDGDLGEPKAITVMTRWDKDSPTESVCASGGVLLLGTIDVDIAKMLASHRFAVRCDKGTYVFDLEGFKETMELAGCAP